MPSIQATSRREFLRFMAGSPVLAGLGLSSTAWSGQQAGPEDDPGADLTDVLKARGSSPGDAVSTAQEAINVFDLQAVARKTLPAAHYGYIATGVEGDATLRANREGFGQFALRPRRLVDVRKVDMSVEFLGRRWDTPIVLAPAASQRAFHPDGEAAVARAAREHGHLQILSTATTVSVEDVNTQRGEPVWFQLYPTNRREIGRAMVRRAERAGCPALVLTVDIPVGAQRDTALRFYRRDPRNCAECHADGMAGYVKRKPMFDGLDLSGVKSLTDPGMDWNYAQQLRNDTEMKLIIKGIQHPADARRCVDIGADAIIVSNHGGRGEESGLSTIESLPAVLDAVQGRVPVLIDGGFRRGSDILKALTLGAAAICIGRPYLWGLGAFGQAGVERTLQILRAELRASMQQCGITSLAQLDTSYLAP